MSEEKKQEKPYWEDKEYSFFSHKNCEYFPCHEKEKIRTILTVCSATVPCTPWAANAVVISNILTMGLRTAANVFCLIRRKTMGTL